MGAMTSLVPWNDKIDKTQPRVLEFTFTLTSGALTTARGYPVLVTTGALTQAVIDAYLGNSSDVNYLYFDATSMGTDAVGFIIDMAGQAKSLEFCEIIMRSGTGNVTTVRRFATAADTMTASQLAVSDALLTSAGNIAYRAVVTSLDSTTGYITLRVGWISK